MRPKAQVVDIFRVRSKIANFAGATTLVVSVPFCACVARQSLWVALLIRFSLSVQFLRLFIPLFIAAYLRVKPRPSVAAKHDKQCEKEVGGLCCLACGAESCQLKASVQQSREYGILLDFGLCQNPPKFRMLTPQVLAYISSEFFNGDMRRETSHSTFRRAIHRFFLAILEPWVGMCVLCMNVTVPNQDS